MRTLLLNKLNLVDDGYNSKFRFQFSQTIRFNEGEQIAVSSAQIPYSNFNIMSQYNNNKFQYTHNSGSPGSFDVLFNDGFYTVDDMNYYLEQIMISNGHYLVNGDGQNVYYLKISTNQNRYRIQLDCFVIPSTLPTGWTNPASFNLTSYGGKCFNFNFIAGQKFQSLIGFNDGAYGANNLVNTSYLGQSVPSPALVNSYLITVPTLVNQSAININTTSAIYAKTPDVDFGNNIIMEPNAFVWIDVNPGNYSYIDVVLCSGDDGRQLTLQDPNSLILLVVKTKDERS